MQSTISPKITLRFILVSIVTMLFFTSCQKTLSTDETPTQPIITTTPPDLTTKVTTTIVSGFVTDGNEAAVKDASVLIGTTTVLTDKYGYFEARNVQMIQNAAVVTVTKAGFFKGIKTFIAVANKAAFFRIKLIPKIISGTINGTSGGAITLASGLSINFPANAVVNATTNAAYTGTVNIIAFKIDPTSTDLNRIMPGDLRGLNTEGNLQLLTTYGMAAVELTGTSGELLQIATGKKATMTMTIPTSILASAPATIPLWYFDEAVGLWKQEGTATKTGNNYVGEVSHFSFWNYDVPANYVQFNCTVVNSSGQPIPNVLVKISLLSNPLMAAYGYADSSGYVSGAVPSNALLLLEVFGNGCNVASHSQTFTTTNINISLGAVTISTTSSISTITGSVTNCSNAPVTNGFIIIQNGFIFTKHALSNTGTYSVTRLLCGTGSNNITLIGEDATAAQQSNAAVYPIIAGANAIPTIQACGVSIQQFVNYTINATAYNYSAPVDSLTLTGGGTNTDYIIYVANNVSSNFGTMRFTRTGIAQGSIQNLMSFTPIQIPTNTTINTPIGINITEYGAIGQYVAGNFSGVITGPSPANTVYNVTCNFRIRRTF